MTPRLRLPAYGRQLLNERRLNRHPLVVHLAYGEQLHHGTHCDLDCAGGFEPEKLPKAPPGAGDLHPHLWVKPSEFTPFKFDWHAVTGCAVCVFDDRPDFFEGARNFYELLGELGRFAGPVRVFRLEPLPPKGVAIGRLKSVEAEASIWRWEFCWQAHILACGPSWRRAEKLPDWWPPETEETNGKRRERWAAIWAARHERVEAAA